MNEKHLVESLEEVKIGLARDFTDFIWITKNKIEFSISEVAHKYHSRSVRRNLLSNRRYNHLLHKNLPGNVRLIVDKLKKWCRIVFYYVPNAHLFFLLCIKTHLIRIGRNLFLRYLFNSEKSSVRLFRRPLFNMEVAGFRITIRRYTKQPSIQAKTASNMVDDWVIYFSSLWISQKKRKNTFIMFWDHVILNGKKLAA